MKRQMCIIALALIFVIALSGCIGETKSPLNIGGAEVSREIYSYYLDKVVGNPLDYGLTLSADAGDCAKNAQMLCAEYVAINTAFAGTGLSLSPNAKADIAADVSDSWKVFGSYYSKLGITKQTITNIKTCEASREALFLAYYDKDGIAPVPEETLKAYFEQNYVAFQAVNGYLTYVNEDGETATYTDDEIESLRTRFDNWKKKIDSGHSLEEVGSALAAEQGLSTFDPSVHLIEKGGSLYPDGFFEKVAELETGKPEVLEFPTYIFLVVRTDMTNDADDYYKNCRTSILYKLKSEEFESTLDALAGEYKIAVDDEVADKIYSEVEANA